MYFQKNNYQSNKCKRKLRRYLRRKERKDYEHEDIIKKLSDNNLNAEIVSTLNYTQKDTGYVASLIDITDKKRVEEVIEVAQSKNTLDSPPKLRAEFSYEILDKSSASEIADIYKKVFDTYPFPIHNPEYIKKTMDENFIYFGIQEQDKLVGISSSEMDEEEKNVEMTDFAVLPEYRGNSFAVFLLQKMEEKMKAKGINTFFTIARAVSFGMNATFAKMGYHYSGTLVKNTNISGNIESMNIWYKSSEEIIK